MNTIMINKCIVGDTYEQCLQDFITYLQNVKEEQIYALVRTSRNDIHAVFHVINRKYSSFKVPIQHLYDLYITEKIIVDEKTEITQEDILDWCKPYDLPDMGFTEKPVERYIYTVFKNGAISKYSISSERKFIGLDDGKRIKDKVALNIQLSAIY